MVDEKKRDMGIDVAGMMENAFLLGIGVLEMTRDKATEMADDLIERGKVSQSEAKKVAERIGDIAEEQQQRLRHTVAKETDEALKTAGVATKADLDDLREQIAELKALLVAKSTDSAGATASAGAASAGGAPAHPSEGTIADLPAD